MSDLRISTQPGDTNGAERAKRATAVTDAMAFATTTGAMLLGILAAEAEQQQASAAAVGHDVQDLQGATAPHDTPQVDAGALAPEASGANAASRCSRVMRRFSGSDSGSSPRWARSSFWAGIGSSSMRGMRGPRPLGRSGCGGMKTDGAGSSS